MHPPGSWKPKPKKAAPQQKKVAAPAQAVQQQPPQQEPAQGISDDPIEMEEKYHEPDTMVSMSVIEHEMEYLKVLLIKYKNQPDEKEFFEMRIESLDFAKSGIETNVQTGVLSPEGYVKQL